MWKFMLGLLLGLAARAVYDLFKDEPLATGGLGTARIEALLDETRQTLRDLRDDVQKAAGSGASALQARAHDVRAAAAPVASAVQDKVNQLRDVGTVTTAPAPAPDATEPAAASGSDTNGASRLDPTPRTTRGSLETMA